MLPDWSCCSATFHDKNQSVVGLPLGGKRVIEDAPRGTLEEYGSGYGANGD